MSETFLDSNVLVYLFDETNERKYEIAQEIIDEALKRGTASISFQVVQEVLNLLTTKFASRTTPEGAQSMLRNVLMPLWRVMPSRQLYQKALELPSRYGYHFYDCLIIAAALDDGCSRLMSEDLQHGQRIEGLTIVNPFRDS